MRKDGTPNWPQAVLLDLDGTLVDSESLQIEAIARCMQEKGIEVNEEERNFVVGRAWQEIYIKLKIESRMNLDLARFRQIVWLKLLELESEGWQISVLPGANRVFSKLRDWGIPTAIVSGSSRREIERCLKVLDSSRASNNSIEVESPGCLDRDTATESRSDRGAFSITDYLSFFFGAEDYAHGKPNPSGYLMAAQRLGVRAEQCLVVEDSEVGIAAGRSANMAVIGSAAARAVQANPNMQRFAHVVIDSLLGFNRSVVELAMKRAR